jgi:hypothetical protein
MTYQQERLRTLTLRTIAADVGLLVNRNGSPAARHPC